MACGVDYLIRALTRKQLQSELQDYSALASLGESYE